MNKYDVFISYRREGGQDTARIIRDELRAKGFRVFFDVEALRSGKFNEQLLDTIQGCNDFILICSKGALDRCSQPEDWVRQELACALKHNKNVIPVLLRGFEFPSPETLPEDIREVCYCNGLSASHEHFDAFILKLTNFLKARKSLLSFFRSLPFNGRRAASVIVISFVLAGLLAVGGYRMTRGPGMFPGTAEEIACVERLISCSMQNLAVYNNALRIYRDAVDELIKYTNNGSNYQKQYTFDEYALSCRDRILAEREKLQRLDDMDATLIQDAGVILRDRIHIGDANAMESALRIVIDGMTESFSCFAGLYCANGRDVTDPQLAEAIQRYGSMAELDRDSVFYAFNEMLLPVDNQVILNKIKIEYLPVLTTFYVRQDWKTDAADIQSQMDSIYNTELGMIRAAEEELIFDEQQLQQLDAAVESYNKAIAAGGEQQTEVISDDRSTEDVLLELDNFIALLESRREIERILYNDKEGAALRYDEKIQSLKAARDSLREKYQKVQELEARLQAQQEQLRARREEAREKFTPLESDEAEILWGKGVRFITLKMPDMAEECFDMYMEKEGSKEAAVYSEAAKLFVREMQKTGVSGGCVVCAYEEGLPKQKFEIGDILYAVDGRPVRTAQEFSDIKKDRDALVSVLRFQEDGSFEVLEISYDSALGRIALLSLGESGS